MRRLILGALVLLCAAITVAQPSVRQRIIAAEDARIVTDSAIAPILDGLRSSDVTTVARAARALGRFERPALVGHLVPLLAHSREEVRREAANALGQAVAALPREPSAPPSADLTTVTDALGSRLRIEDDPYVRGTIAETLGRLPFRDASTVHNIELLLQRYLPDVEGSAVQPLHPGSVLGVVKGLEALARGNRTVYQLTSVTVSRLRTLAVSTLLRLDSAFIAIRRLAWLAVNAVQAADLSMIEEGYGDPDFQVRRLAIVALALPTAVAADGQAANDRGRGILGRALADPAFQVRYEAIRTYVRAFKGASCQPVAAAASDMNEHVVLAAIDGLGSGCATDAPDSNPITILTRIADQLAPNERSETGQWHRPAHALAALAHISSDEAGKRLPRFTSHPVWHVRVYAARAAATLGNAEVLEQTLATDESANVRYEALQALRRLRGHAADALYVAALASSDYQLVLAAADALEGSKETQDAVPALVRAFTRLTTERRETSRDTRMAILRRLRELGSREHAAVLQDCLRDFDSVVAAECASIVERWTGTAAIVRPNPIQPEPVSDELPLNARVTMSRAGVFELRLLTEDAPASVSRFARLVRRKYYDGLTIHRVVPNFVVQGGSPGGNEYAGDGPFMRDELGLRSNLRGTVGVSTRGRDTGDAQFFINLLDNPRLDHEYTVFAEVTSGMDVVDGIVEGDVIERIELR